MVALARSNSSSWRSTGTELRVDLDSKLIFILDHHRSGTSILYNMLVATGRCCPRLRMTWPTSRITSPASSSISSRPSRGGPNTYRLALFRFAQYALILFDMAFLAAALIGARFRFCVALG